MYEVRACAGGKISRAFEPSLSSRFYCLSFAGHSLGFISEEKFPQKMDRLQPVFLPRSRTRSKERSGVRVKTESETADRHATHTPEAHQRPTLFARKYHTGAPRLAKQILRKKTIFLQFKGRRDGNVRLPLRYGKIGDKNVQLVLLHCCKMRPRPNVELFMRRTKL